MKKFVAGVATAAALSVGALGLTGPADAYGPPAPPKAHVITVVNHAIHKALDNGHKLGPKKAKKLRKKVKAAKRAGLISQVKAKALLHKIHNHTRKHK